MIDVLRDYLGTASSPEFVQMIDEAHAVLEEFGVEDYSDIFVQILMMDDVVDAGQTVQDVHDATHELQRRLLQALGVTVSDEARVAHLTVLARGLKAVEHFHDPVAILRHCELEMHPPELLAEVLALTTGTPAEELLIDIHGVEPSTIQRIIEIVMQAHKDATQDQTPEPSPEDGRQRVACSKARYIEAWQRFQAFSGSPQVLLERFLADGMDVGYPFILYVNMIGPELETFPPEAIAANLVAMALISSDGHENPRGVIASHIDTLLHDLELITKVTVAVSDLLIQCEIGASTATNAATSTATTAGMRMPSTPAEIRTEVPAEIRGHGQANLLSGGDGG